MQRVASTAPVTAAYVSAVNRVNESIDRTRTAMIRNDRGLTTTEVAVLTFILVSIAAAIGLLIYNYAKANVEDIDNINIDPTISTDTN